MLLVASILVALCATLWALDCSEIDWFAPQEDASQFAISQDDLNNCLPEISGSQLDPESAELVWSKIKGAYADVSLIPIEIYEKMEWLLVGIPKEDLINMTLGDVNIVRVFGKYRNYSPEQLRIIAERVRTDWWWKTPQRLSHFDLISLNQILCSYNSTEILKIHADAYKRAAPELGGLQFCPKEVLQSLANLATRSNAFGPPETWSKLDVNTIGVILHGLPQEDFQRIPTSYLPENIVHPRQHSPASSSSSSNDTQQNNNETQ